MSEKRNDPVLETLSPADRARFLNMVKKGVSRRDFMHYMMAAGATAAASGTLFTGVSDAWANAFVAFKGFRSLTDFAFELFIASNRDVKDLD